MDISNNIYTESNTKKELLKKLNLGEMNEKTGKVNFAQQKAKVFPQKSINNDYIMNIKDKISNDIRNRRRDKNERNLIKEMKIIKIFIGKIKNINLLINFMIVINLFIPIFAANYRIRGNSLLNEITIRLNGTGTQNILNGNFEYPADEILIEDNSYSLGEKNTIIINLTNYDNNITMRWNSPLVSCWRMFSGLSNLIEIDLTNFDFSEVTRMNVMFQNCINLEYIKFNNNAEKKINVGDMSSSFENCILLKSLDLSNLNTFNLKNMAKTFYNCWSLTSFDFNGFNTSLVTSFRATFFNCSSLQFLDLSSFDTSNVLTMNSMFYFCNSLMSLNLSSFNTINVGLMDFMFYGCNKLKYLDLSNFDTSKANYLSNLFYNCSELTSIDISNFNIENNPEMQDMFFNCNNLQYINISNFKGNTITNIDYLFESIPENVTYCFNNENEIPEFIEQLKSKKCSINDCSDDWQKKEKKAILDKNICVYDCSLDDEYKKEFKKQCYKDCPNGTYLSPENNRCIIICGEDLPFEQNEECVLNCNAQDFFNSICKINNQNINTKEYMINTLLNEIINGYTDVLLSKVLNEEKKDYFIKNNDTEIFHITSSYNQKNNEYNNVSTIDIGECENILKEKYHISSEETLILFKTDFFIEDFLVPITEYEIFSPLTKEKLDLNYCNEAKIKISTPITIDEQYIYKYDPNSEYYKDKCYPNPSECGNDDILLERKNEFNNNYFSLCENNCIFIEYNKTTKKAICECTFKSEFMKLSEIISKKDELLYHFELETDVVYSSISTNSNLDTLIPTNNNVDTSIITNHNIDTSVTTTNNIDTSITANNNIDTSISTNNNIDTSITTNNNIDTSITTNNNIIDTSFTTNNNSIDNLISTHHNIDTLISTNDNNFYTNKINSESNIITIDSNNLEMCLFKNKITQECEESIAFEDLINQKYLPLNSKNAIDKVFVIFQEQLKNKTIDKNKDEIIEGENIIYHMTTTEQKFKSNKVSNIDLGQCEKILQKKFGIEEPLIIFSADIKRNDTISTQVEYQVFDPNTLEQLNLSECDNVRIDVYTPINIDSETYNLIKYLKDQGYDIFDSSDDFYNDICSTFNSFNDTDIILNDRRKDFYNPNITLCEESCKYEAFDIETLKVKCNCDVKSKVNSDTSKTKFSPNKIIENFYQLEKYANLKVASCYNQVFNLDRLKKNYGSFFMIFIGLLFIISMIIIILTIKRKINNIIRNEINKALAFDKKLNKKEKNKNSKNDEMTSKNLFEYNKNGNKRKNKNIKKNKNANTNTNTNSNELSLFNKANKKIKNKKESNNSINSNKKQKNKKINNPNKKLKNNSSINSKLNLKKSKRNSIVKMNENSKQLFYKENTVNSINEKTKLEKSPGLNKKKQKHNKNINEIFIFSNQINNFGNNFDKKTAENENENNKFIDKVIKIIPKKKRNKYFTDDELNSLSYEYALKIDTRSYTQVYYSLLKQNHLIIFTFCVKDDNNIFLLKFTLFLISISLFFSMNALFFQDESLHKIYEDQGKYKILYQIPQMLYSTIVSQIISSLLEKLSLSQDEISNLKDNSNLKEFKNQTKKIVGYIRIKCILYFIIGIIMLFGFWYYLAAFCAVYYNTQIPLIKDSFISFGTSMLYPFLFDLIPIIFRIFSLMNKIKCCYIFSNILIKIIGIL